MLVTPLVVIKMSIQQTNLVTELFSGFTLDGFINNFHFIRPWWFLAFFALYLVIFLLKKIRYYQSPWQHFLPPHLANALLENTKTAENSAATVAQSTQARYWLKPLIIGSCIIVALAGPAWQKLPQPVYQLERGAVLIMDMSYSMYATDVKPNRLTRARYKAIDLLKKINEGDVGLIAYAGDAFIISPLTQDIKNIELLLPSLSPDIMPVHGANALAALMLADKTLKNSGHLNGDIYWFTDDIENDEISDVYAWANDNGHKVNILGVGSTAGAPIKLSGGKLLKNNKGAIVIPKLPEGRLAAIAKRSRGVYRTMTNDDTDIKALTAHLSVGLDEKVDLALSKLNKAKEQQNKQALQGDQYQEQGPWLLIIILPLILSYFRRGTSILTVTTLMPLTLLMSLISITPSSYAADSTTAQPLPTKTAETSTANSASQLWQNLWQTSDQQAQYHYQNEDFQQAAKQFENSQWQGSAHYKAGDYQQALDAFKQSDSPQALYNQGNALAQLQQVDEAIDAYKNALKKDPSLSDAKENLAKLEALKKQQEQSKKDSQQSQDEKSEQQDTQNDQQKQDSEQQSQDQSKNKNQGEQEESDKQGEQGEQQQQSDETEKQKQESEQQQASDKSKEQKEQDEKSKQANKAEEEKQSGDDKSLAQQASDKKAQETQQKHQQLLNKVTDDPYLLLRNKMRLEYQKRRQEVGPPGETKKW